MIASFTDQRFHFVLPSMDYPSFVCLLFGGIFGGIFFLSLPKALNVGSQTQSMSIIHRWSGIMSLMLPFTLTAYHWVYETDPNVFLYLFTVIVGALNCIAGAVLITKRLPKWDTPTIRNFVEYSFHSRDPFLYFFCG